MKQLQSFHFILSPLENEGGAPAPLPENQTKKKKRELPEVFIVRNWKEYLGESLLIIFSVTLAIILLSFESRKRENARTTLILVRDNFSAWAINRAPHILDLYQKAIAALSNY